MDEEISEHITEHGTVWVPSEDLPTELTLVSFRRDLLLMPSIMLSRFPKLERSRPVRLTGVAGTILQLTEDEINLLGTRQILTVADGGFVYILPNSDRLREAKREAQVVVERALNPAGTDIQRASEGSLVVISYANQGSRVRRSPCATHARVFNQRLALCGRCGGAARRASSGQVVIVKLASSRGQDYRETFQVVLDEQPARPPVISTSA